MATRLLETSAAAFAVLVLSGLAMAQAPMGGNFKPISKPGGYAQQELQAIYQQSIGTGFTSASVTNNILSSARAFSPGYRAPSGPASVGPRIGLGVGGGSAPKPFTSYSPAPTVSPYLNLFREDFEGGGDLNYNTLVRPQLQQQQFNQDIQRESLLMERRLQAFAAQSDFNPQGSTSQLPTGHQTVFRYYGRYYPSMYRYRR